MEFDPPLVEARLVRRYKRFLADVAFPDGRVETAHVQNPGAMMGVDAPNSPVLLSPAKAGRKLAWSLHFVKGAFGWAGVDTALPNRLVGEALRARALPAFAAYDRVRPEVRYGEESRIDFLLEADGRPPLYLEVKNCHLMRQAGVAEFPDCTAARSARHMRELAAMVGQGAQAAVFVVVQMETAERFQAARDLDPAFAQALDAARAAGVTLHAWRCAISPRGLRLAAPIETP